MKKENIYVMSAQIKADEARKKLASRMRSLSVHLSHLANELDDGHCTINSCGECQGEAARIDQQCAEYALLKEFVKEMQHATKKGD